MSNPDPSDPPSTISILTINVWFGLEERGVLKMSPLEPPGRAETRYQILTTELRALQPDFIAVQEANPIPRYSQRLARELGYDEIHQVYNGGIKIGSLGIPLNLKMGLVLLAKRQFHLKSAGARQISGDRLAVYRDCLCFHFTDSRWVMAGTASVGGRKLFILHTHTYAGPSGSPEILHALDRCRERREISEKAYQRYMIRFQRTARRQKNEVERILHYLKETCGGEPALLVGDFNLAEDNALMGWLIREGGLWDTYRMANPGRKGITWDADHNENTKWLGGLFSIPEQQRGPAYHVRAAYDRQSRKIDYIFLNSAFRKNHILESRIVLEQPVGGVHASDHYGVMSIVSLPPEQRP